MTIIIIIYIYVSSDTQSWIGFMSYLTLGLTQYTIAYACIACHVPST